MVPIVRRSSSRAGGGKTEDPIFSDVSPNLESSSVVLAGDTHHVRHSLRSRSTSIHLPRLFFHMRVKCGGQGDARQKDRDFDWFISPSSASDVGPDALKCVVSRLCGEESDALSS